MRLEDHSALALACAESESVALAFVYDSEILGRLVDRDDRRVTFIRRSLEELRGELAGRGSELLACVGNPVDQVPRLAEQLQVEAVYCARDTEPYALRRDAEVAHRLARIGVDFVALKDQVVLEGLEVANQQGEPYKVFTPYFRRWQEVVRSSDLEERAPDLTKLWPSGHLPSCDATGNPSLEQLEIEPAEVWLQPGSSGAQSRLRSFLSRVDRYADERDFPGEDATSGISAHLRFGTLSIRSCFRAVWGMESPGARKWLAELVWREFYQMILACFPHVETRCFLPEYDAVEWPGSNEHFEAWCAGRTGYPFVDAAMRCLRQTGWMHNRSRMVVASFLVKDLLVDWRLGEAWFARWLLDFDLASNNGGWQWAASTGVDAQPYFRIFNPVHQSRKFDPDGAFIRRWVPELADLPGLDVHEPHRLGCPPAYPAPIVAHEVQRAHAIRLLESARGKRTGL